jgi:two-component system response regulator EvgA
MKALVVDDSRVIRYRVVEMLGEIASLRHISQAADGLEALQVIGQMRPDLVVLDIQMPSVDGKRMDSGMDVLLAIKAGLNPPAVIMLSNFSDPQYRAQCARLGADAFLDKSNDFSQLVAIAEALLASRHKLRQGGIAPTL